MMKWLGVLMLFLSFNAAATCVATTRGPVCDGPQTCGGGWVWNAQLGACEPTSCPPGANAVPFPGGGFLCQLPALCLDGNGHIVSCNQQVSQSQPEVICTIEARWSLHDPKHASITSNMSPECAKDADLATNKMMFDLLGGT